MAVGGQGADHRLRRGRRTIPTHDGPRCEAGNGGSLGFVMFSITVVECLVHPVRRGDVALTNRFRMAITHGVNLRYVGVDPVVEQAALLRARHNLSLTDALQVASAIAEG